MDLPAPLWLFLGLFLAAGANSDHHPLRVSAAHVTYTCPAGANVTLVCTVSGDVVQPKDRVQHLWLYTPHADQRCHDHSHPRGLKNPHGNRSMGVVYGSHAKTFTVTLFDVTSKDQGRYCCISLDLQLKDHHKVSVQQAAHSHVLLVISPRRNDTNCTVFDPNTPSQSTVAPVLVTIVFIMGILCLPLILVLVYRQRQGAHGSRRAHELVRMDSEAQGHENPVFMAGTPQPKPRTVSQIMTRQLSETGCHLLSDPGTPLTPNPQGDVFFPAQDPIPESPDFMQV